MSDLTALPRRIPAGTSVTYTRTYPDYPAGEGWELTLHLAFPAAVAVDATAEGDSFVLVLAAADLEDVAAGVYQWAERVTDGVEVIQVASGLVEITPNLATADAADLQTTAEQLLPIVEAALTGKLQKGFESYQIGGRALSTIPLSELQLIRRQLIDEIRSHRNPGRVGRTFHVRF